MPEPNRSALLTIKILHTAIWAFFVSCIIAIPILAQCGDHAYSGVLIGVVLLEVLVLLFNRWQCPLTTVAARHSSDRRDNFDIFLPVWLARYNELIFGVLYLGGSFHALVAWWSAAA